MLAINLSLRKRAERAAALSSCPQRRSDSDELPLSSLQLLTELTESCKHAPQGQFRADVKPLRESTTSGRTEKDPKSANRVCVSRLPPLLPAPSALGLVRSPYLRARSHLVTVRLQHRSSQQETGVALRSGRPIEGRRLYFWPLRVNWGA